MNKNRTIETRSGGIRLLEAPPPELDADALLADFTRYFGRTLGRQEIYAESPYVYSALVYTIRDRLIARWNKTSIALESSDQRRVYYLSLEFLMGRLLTNALLNLGVREDCERALQRLGVSLATVFESEHDAGLGNGGLGRLAACFLDSCATLRLPVVGYGIRYQYGMFRQRIDHGYQIEEPEPWLIEGFPWEIEQFEHAQIVSFGGRKETVVELDGTEREQWVDTHDVLAVPYDVPVPGYRNDVVNTLRLWSAKATSAFDLEEFNAGSYTQAVAAKNDAENITMVLYPNDASENGKSLRLRQQYFLVSASLKDTLASWVRRNGNNFATFAAKNCYQLNDTHPAIAVPELMRLLIDEHAIEWDEAWVITREVMAYTNHTLLPEALETWSVGMIKTMLPRIMEIIYQINARFLDEVAQRWPGDGARLARMSLIDENGEPRVRMAYLAIIGSRSVNGVAALHSKLLREGLFRDFAELWPTRFNNKTNGVTQRRWLAACNPGLAELVTSRIGDAWVTDLDALAALAGYADDPEFQQAWRSCRVANKRRLARYVAAKTDVVLSPDMLFDVQVKRIHEYKRQLLNVLHAIHRYDELKRSNERVRPPRAIIIGGKAAPGYVMAKHIIKFINDVAGVINADPDVADQLRLVFVPNYNVSAMEIICPAADLSEQISTAGKEASGTGNMKFMMNGAVTIGTLDGANVEIREAVGEENFFLFGLTIDQIDALRPSYDPNAIIAADAEFSRVMALIETGALSGTDATVKAAITAAIRSPHDPWMIAADFRSFVDAQRRVDDAFMDLSAWTRMSIANTAASGRFSTDRTMREYNDDIWHLEPIAP